MAVSEVPGLQSTYAMIKPDAVRAGKAEEICQLIEISGFTILAKKRMQLTQQRAQEFYAEHKGKPFFERLVAFMSSGPICALVLAKADAIKEWRSLMGPTNVFVARAEKPKCLRALYGTDGTMNATHGSDSPASASREIRFFFPKLTQDPLPTAKAAQAYLTEHLEPVLLRGLTELARARPAATQAEALQWLGQWLLDNNPNKPRILLPEAADLAGIEEDDEAAFGSKEQPEAPGPVCAGPDAAAVASVSTMAQEPAEASTEAASTGVTAAAHSETVQATVAAQDGGSVDGPAEATELQEEAGDLGAATDADLDAAAIKVQAAYRGHRVRQSAQHPGA